MSFDYFQHLLSACRTLPQAAQIAHGCRPASCGGGRRPGRSYPRNVMPRFSRGARVLFAAEKTTGRIGTIIGILPKHADDIDRYEVEFTDGEIKTLSDLELAPAGAGPTSLPVEDVPGNQ